MDFSSCLTNNLFPHPALFGDENDDIAQDMDLTGQAVTSAFLLETKKLSFRRTHGREVISARFNAVLVEDALLYPNLALSADRFLTADSFNIHAQCDRGFLQSLSFLDITSATRGLKNDHASFAVLLTWHALPSHDSL
jgi:hypothetical protein